MRHRRLDHKFGRSRSERKQLMRSLARALFISYSIQTTLEKAKEARRLAERLITFAKKKSLADIRQIEKVLQDRTLVKKLVDKIAPLFNDRKGGYTRITRLGFRKGDGANLAILELVAMPEKVVKPKKEKKPKVVRPQAPQEAPKKEAPKEAPKKPEEKHRQKEHKPAPPAKKPGGIFGKFRNIFRKGE